MPESLGRSTTPQVRANRPNGWVTLDREWARLLGVQKDQGVYRLRHRELLKRLSPQIPSLFTVPGTWTIDPGHTNVGFVASHLSVAKVRGEFREVSGTVSVGPTPQESWVDVIIESASVDTGQSLRDAHLRSADFLDSETHPQMRFTSTDLEICGPHSCKLAGNLAIRGVTRPVTLDLEYLGTATDQFGKSKVAFEARARIDREEFGLVWNRVLEAGGVLVGRHIELQIEAQAVAPAA